MANLLSLLLIVFFVDIAKAEQEADLEWLKGKDCRTVDKTFSEFYENLNNVDDDSVHYFWTSVLKNAEVGESFRVWSIATKYYARFLFEKQGYDDGVQLLDQGINLAIEQGLQEELAYLYLEISDYFLAQNSYEKSLKLALEAINIFGSLEDKVMLSCAYVSAAKTYLKAGDFEEAIKNSQNTIRTFKQLATDQISDGDLLVLAKAWNILGLGNLDMGLHVDALFAFEKSIAIASGAGHQGFTDLVKGNIGELYFRKGDYNKALDYLLDDHITSKAVGNVKSAVLSAILISNLFIDQCKWEDAKQYLDFIGATLKNENFPLEKLRYFSLLSDYYLHQADTTKAFLYLKEYQRVKDSLAISDQVLKVSEMKASHNIGQKLSEIELLTQINQSKDKEIKAKNNLLYVSSFLVVGTSVLLAMLLVSYRQRRRSSDLLASKNEEIAKKNKKLAKQSTLLSEQFVTIQSINNNLEKIVKLRTLELEKISLELDTFLYRASHDIRRPITTILGLEKLAQLTINHPDSNTLFKKISETAIQMDNMLYKLQMVHELNQTPDVLQDVSLKNVLYKVIDKYRENPGFKDFRFTCELVPPNIHLKGDPHFFCIIFENLVENAIHFRKKVPGKPSELNIRATQSESGVSISFEDNGIGIEPKYQSKIFEPYFRGSEDSKGNGLGLYLAKKSAEKLNAKLSVSSKYGQGTVFSVTWRVENMIGKEGYTKTMKEMSKS